MKIAYVCADIGIPVLGSKGASVHVREFTDALFAAQHEVQVFCTAKEKESRGEGVENRMRAALHVFPPSEKAKETSNHLADALLRLGCPHQRKDLLSEFLHVLTDQELIDAALPLLRDFAPDLLIARHAIFSIAGPVLARELDCPCVLEVNAPLIEERRRYWSLTLEREAELAERRAFEEADLLVAVSEGVLAYLLRYGAAQSRVLVLPNGVSQTRFHPAISGNTVRERYDLSGKLVIGFTGSLKPWHGVERLLQAFASIRSTLATAAHPLIAPSTLHVLIVGDGPEYAHLVQVSQELEIADAVTFTGYISHEQVPEHIAAFDIAAAPYLPSENFYFSPLKIMEYLAMGCATLAPALGQIPALLYTADGACGIVYPPHEPQALANALLHLIQDEPLRQKLGKCAVTQARKRSSWQTIVQRLFERLHTSGTLSAAVRI